MKKMEYSTEFIDVEIKYDFINNLGESNESAEWTRCRFNVKPLEKIDGWLQVMCYPKRYDEVSPYFLFELDIKKLKCGPVASRTNSNVYGLFWNLGPKKCKLFFAFENKCDYDSYVAYLKNVLRALEKLVKEQEVAYENAEPFSLNLTLNDGLVAGLNQTLDIKQSFDAAADNPSAGSPRISDASDIYQEVQLRHPEHEKRRPMRRPIAILSDLFTVKRTKSVSSDTKLNKTPDLPPRNRLSTDDGKTTVPNKTLKKKRSIWNLMSKSKKCRSTNSMAEQRMPQSNGHPLCASSMTELNLNAGNYVKFDSFDNIFDLNSMPDIDDMLKAPAGKLNSSKTAETRRSTASCNVMWSHNLSRSFTSQGDVSNINLIGANVNREQIHSEVFIEQDSRHMPFDVPMPKNFLKFRKYEVDANGYAVMRPIITDANKDSQPKNDSSHTTYVSIEDIARNARNLECNYDIIRKPARRKLSLDSQSSSGCSSDNEDQACEAQPEKIQSGEANSDDEAISMKFTECSPLSSPTKSTSSFSAWCDTNPPEKLNECAILENDIEPMQAKASVGATINCCSSTSRKMTSESDTQSNLATAPSNDEPSFATAAELESDESFVTLTETNDIPQMIMNAEAPSAELETGDERNGDSILVHIDPKQCSHSTRSINPHEMTKSPPCANGSRAKAQSYSKRIWRTCNEFRKMAGSLVSVRRAMLNFGY